jgi:hypothetical protein
MSLILDGTNGLSDVDGSAATPAIRGSDANTGIFFDADIIGFSEGGTECARFNADAQFVAAAGTASLPVITTTGDVNTGIFFPAADTIAFAEGGAEAMRIDSSGNLLVGTTSNTSNRRLLVLGGVDGNFMSEFNNTLTSGTAYGAQVRFSFAPNNATSEFILCTDTGADRFIVRSNGGIANFSGNNVNLSDRREKTNFAPAKSYLETICAIPVQTFNYIDQNHEEDPGLTLGVVAQDVQEVAPELVMESNWGTAEEPKMRLSIYQTDLQYALMKCIQEQQAIITALTARVEALEGAQA